MSFTESDKELMRLALLEANNIVERVSPNPKVGAIISKNGVIISKGSHKAYGESHAEVNAIKNSNGNAKGSELYVTLEPCSHYGKTPPCTDAIIKSGIKKVIFAMKDPNPLVSNNNSCQILENAGIEVQFGLLEEDALKLNQAFIKGIKTNQPYLVAKWAMTLDGKISTSQGESKWITNEKARQHAHFLRSQYDAIAIGKNTLEQDNPNLNCRYDIKLADPYRLIFLSKMKIDYLKLNVFQNKDGKTILIIKELPDAKLCEELQNKKIQIIFQDSNIDNSLNALFKLGISSILIEGGSELLGYFFDKGKIDYCHCFIAPIMFGGNGLNAIKGQGIKKITDAWQLKSMKISQFDDNIHLQGPIQFYR
jgi:diaminohydroxyphosphoribosylaminopyrimidine deaminase/5-amino-6-(5-phosphoribosylamino)uracil reductase